MINILKLINMPEYLYQPSAAVKRLLGHNRRTGNGIVQLIWGIPLEVNFEESIGAAISHHGLFEISAVEAIFRLLDPEDIFFDVGANIGFMSAVALSAGARQIHSFEPHPVLFENLSNNASMWTHARPSLAGRVTCHRAAISESVGNATLHVPKAFSGNQGISSLENLTEPTGATAVDVCTTTIDRAIGDLTIGILKIDVEGHEMLALNGACNSLKEGRIRDIIFEDHRGFDSPVARRLSDSGYTIFGINKSPLGPVLLSTHAEVLRYCAFSNEALNFLATRDPARARRRMSGWGFKCLRARFGE